MTDLRDFQDAFLMGTLYKQCGGAFCIDSNGKRHIIRQFEQVYSSAERPERERVLNVLETLIRGLSDESKAFLFDAFADCAVDPATITATVSEPMRGAA